MKTHQKRKYSTEIVTDTKSQPKEKAEESSVCSSEDSDKEGNKSDWEMDPDVHIEEEHDERRINDICSGRIYRKPFAPMPVIAPVKKMKPTATITSAEALMEEHIDDTDVKKVNFDDLSSAKKVNSENLNRKRADSDEGVAVHDLDRKEENKNYHKIGVDRGLAMTCSQKDKVASNLNTSNKVEVSIQRNDACDSHETEVASGSGNLEIDFSIKGENKTRQNFSIRKDGEQLLSSTSVNIACIPASDMNLNLEDFLGPKMLDPREISLHVQKECITIRVNSSKRPN